MSITEVRQKLAEQSLTERDVDPDPIVQFETWFAQAASAGFIEPSAMAVATATPDGRPSVRMILLKGVDARGFVWFTDYRSRKGHEVDANPHVSLCFWWDSLMRQVRVDGVAARIPNAESAEYFRTRPHGSRVGAWASTQSSVLPSREALEREVARYFEQYPEGADVPLPHHWGGYRVSPEVIEFWQGRANRLHDRIVYVREGGGWKIQRLSP